MVRQVQAGLGAPGLSGAVPKGMVTLQDFEVLQHELVHARHHTPMVTGADGKVNTRIMSIQDNTACKWGHFAINMLYRHSINTALLKESLGECLSAFPWLSGRLHKASDGLLDIDCSSRGALFAVGASSTSLEQLQDALAPDATTGAAPYLVSPWVLQPGYFMAGDVMAMVKAEVPLLMGLLVHLSGGGCVLAIAAHHALCDYKALECVAAHWSAAYNAALARRLQQQQQQAACGTFPDATVNPGVAGDCDCKAASCTAGTPGTDPVIRLAAVAGVGGSSPELGGEDEAAAAAAAAAASAAVAADIGPPVVDAQWDEPYRDADAAARAGLVHGDILLASGLLEVPRILWTLAYHYSVRGGGCKPLILHVPVARQAELKWQANQELAAARVATATDHAAAADTEPLPEWVSTTDALEARVLQVLAGLPVHAGKPLHCLLAANMRPRLDPPLPAGHLHNVVHTQYWDMGPDVCGATLGQLAGRLRAAINSTLVPLYRAHLASLPALLARCPPESITMAPMTHPELGLNFFAPEGCIMLNQWQVDARCYRFGGHDPLLWMPAARMGPTPNMVMVMPQPDGSVLLTIGLQMVVWRHLVRLHGGLHL